MSPLSLIRNILLAWKRWRWKRIVGPIVERIAEIDAEIERRRRQHRRTSSLDREKRNLKNRQMKLEMSL